MDPKKCKIFTSFSIIPDNSEILTPTQNSWKYRKFLPTEQICQKFHKFFSPHKIDKNFTSFCPHKFVLGTNRENFYQVFVPPAKLRDKIFRPQKCTARFVTGGDVPTRDKTFCTICHGGTVPPPPPVTIRAF